MILHTVLNNKKEYYSNWLQDHIYNLADSTFTIPDNYQYEILEVTERYVARPDILSFDIYGDTLFADLLCKLNGISNPFELKKGMVIDIPSPDCIMDFMKEVSIEETESGFDNSLVPTPKTRSEKRKPNEAVVGDTRFKIDKNKGIVIY